MNICNYPLLLVNITFFHDHRELITHTLEQKICYGRIFINFALLLGYEFCGYISKPLSFLRES